MSKFLVPVDGSKESCIAAAWAAKTASVTGGSITLLHVYDLHAAEAMALSHLTKEEVKQLLDEKAAPVFAKAVAAITVDNPAVDKVSVIGNPADEILEYAKAKGFDHIVMGRRGLSPLGEFFMGSVTEKVMKRASCPVTVLH